MNAHHDALAGIAADLVEDDCRGVHGVASGGDGHIADIGLRQHRIGPCDALAVLREKFQKVTQAMNPLRDPSSRIR